MSLNPENPVNKISELLQSEGIADNLNSRDKNQELDESQALPDESPEDTEDESLPVKPTEDTESQDDDVADTLNDFARELGADIQDMYALNVKRSTGELVTLGQLKDFYDENHDLEATRASIEEREADLERERAELAKIPKTNSELINAKAQVRAIEQAYEATNWQQLRAENPAEYAAQMADFQQRYSVAKQQEQQATEGANKQIEAHREIERTRLFERNPELKDESVLVDTVKKINTVAAKYGISSQEINAIDDHRYLSILIDLANQTTAKETVKSKKVAEFKTKKPSAPRTPTRKAALKRLTERARATGETRDQVAAISALLET